VQSYDIVAVQPTNQKVFLVSNGLIFTSLCDILCLKVLAICFVEMFFYVRNAAKCKISSWRSNFEINGQKYAFENCLVEQKKIRNSGHTSESYQKECSVICIMT